MQRETLGGVDDPVAREAAVEDATDELTALVVDELLPVAHRYRLETARRLGLGLPELLCLDLLRHLGPLPSGTIGDLVGLTRSTVSKMIRRLEETGHVRRGPSLDHPQAVEVTLVAHEVRDLLTADFRRGIRSVVHAAVRTHGLHRDDHRARAAGLLIQIVHVLHRTAITESERVWWRRAGVRRRKARLAARGR